MRLFQIPHTQARGAMPTGSMTDLARIRNFAIVAHIDHGKSTLADRMIERCGGLEAREMTAQVLDSHGHRARARHHDQGADGAPRVTARATARPIEFNLIDTPGHVDFSYEVSRSLRACEGSLLLVDATQGVEAQTLANAYQAIEADHEIVPVLNKIDLPAAEPERIKQQIEDIIGLDAQRRADDLGQDRRWASTTCSRRSCSACRRRRATPTAPLKALRRRQLVRPLSRRGDPAPGQGRHARARARRSA